MRYVEGHNIEDVRMARRIAEDAVTTCPESAGAYYSMACVHLVEYWIGAGKSSPESLEAGIEMALKAISIDDSNAKAHTLLGNFYAIKRDYDKAIAEGQRAIALSPGAANAYEFYGQSLNYAGRSEEAIPLLQKAIRLNPVSPTQAFLFLGHAFRMTRRYEEAASAFKKALERAPENILAHLALAGTYGMMGRENEARAEAAEVLRLNPKFSLDHYASLHPHKRQSETDRYINALRQAGLK
jgi:adenylate cyclase